MTTDTRTSFLTPAGRLVKGSLYKGNDKDAEGKPLVVKSGPNMGQPRKDFYFALAIPKGPEQHWAQTEWGAKIYAAGQAAFANAFQSPAFAWKVKDGDSTIPNRKGKVPAKQEGYPGHWVLSFSSGYPAKLFRDNGTTPMVEPDAINLGDWVQVFGTVSGNGSSTQPGVFLNHSMVNFIGYGTRIVVGPDPTSVGFGAALPAGASATPLTGTWAPTMPAVMPIAPGTMPAAMQPPQQPPAMPAPAVVVQPHQQFVQAAVAAVPPPFVPPAAAMPPPVRQMTAKAAGATYESFIGAGWTDQTLVQHGYMAA
jgi:hypothetical protein